MTTLTLLLAAVLSLNGEWKLDYFPQPDDGAVRTLPLAVPHETVKAAAECPFGVGVAELQREAGRPPAEIALLRRRGNALLHRGEGVGIAIGVAVDVLQRDKGVREL